MRAPLLLGLLVLLGAAPQVGAAGPAPRLAPGSRLWVDGTASIGSFSCRTSTLRLEAAGPHTADLRVPASKLDCGNRIINGHMRATLRSEEHPEIALRLDFPEDAWARAGEEVALRGTLTLGGDARPVEVRAEVEAGEDGALRVRGTHEILLSDHGLKTPSFLLKLLSVHDRVRVRFDLGLLR